MLLQSFYKLPMRLPSSFFGDLAAFFDRRVEIAFDSFVAEDGEDLLEPNGCSSRSKKLHIIFHTTFPTTTLMETDATRLQSGRATFSTDFFSAACRIPRLGADQEQGFINRPTSGKPSLTMSIAKS